jgi:hypothetical protein
VTYVNFSSINCDGIGALIEDSGNLNLSQCTFINVSASFVLAFNVPSENSKVDYLNIVQNAGIYALVYFWGNWTIMDAIFSQNKGTLCYPSNYGTLTFGNCYFDKDVPSEDYIRTPGCRVTVTATWVISHLNTYMCPADIIPSATKMPASTPPAITAPKDSHRNLVGPIVGGVCGGLVLGFVIGAVTIFFVKRGNKVEVRVPSDALVSRVEPWNYRYDGM